ncbi:protein furry isoform X3 [Contarinia nasturtii]|uniref:protein furry isoform X3 n=1 Tax=Contarinia nasturtii TaxID=265458 RepID=UPI0012D376E9|nr:protein furry isoform X3 [Contarinia nasturtii]
MSDRDCFSKVLPNIELATRFDADGKEVQVEQREDEEQNAKQQDIFDILVAAGYFRARIKGLSAFDKIVGGMTWCISACDYNVDVDLLFHENLTIGQKITLTEKIVAALPKMKCPYLIEPHQIQGLDFINIFPVIQWLVKRSASSSDTSPALRNSGNQSRLSSSRPTSEQNSNANPKCVSEGSASPLGHSSSSATTAADVCADNQTVINLDLDASKLSNSSNRQALLPWGSTCRSCIAATSGIIDMQQTSDTTLRPGEIVMRILFAEFTQQAEKKIELVMLELSDKNLAKLLQRGEDLQFDQLLSAFGSVAEHCLPSLLVTLLAWHNRQLSDAEIKSDLKRMEKIANKPNVDMELQLQRRETAVEFIFCLVLIEILRQLPFHPGHEDIVKSFENLAFKHFKYRDGLQNNPNAHNIHMIADLNAEVIAVLAQSRFGSVRKRFMAELKELRTKEPSPHTTQSIISLLMGMKFFRVKMVPIEEFEASFQFMHECAQYFLEVKDKDIKHALAGLFVEILVPVAAAVKNEVNVPCVKNFVDLLYSQTLDACTKSKHKLALFPLVTCLLCVSQKTFFLSNWHCFLAMCLSNLKNRDQKMSRVALESLYRLLWVYMIRIKCESNSATHSRLQSIVNSLFPRGSKSVVPRDTPLNIFVKIIQFIAQERLDFAMKEIVFELLWVGRPIKIIMTPERMSIGLRAFLVVADSLQQKDGEPPMPRTVGVLPSGNTLKVKKTYINKMLTDDTARSIGMSSYFPHVRRVFVEILRALDVHYGRPLMLTSTQNLNKEPVEMLTGERKPRIDLFRTCVAAVPRLIPDTMTMQELVDMLARLTVHMDEELRTLAHQSLQTLVVDFPDWRQDVIHGYTQFIVRDVLDTYPQLVDNCTRLLLIFINIWRSALGNYSTGSLLKPTTTATTCTATTTISQATVSSVQPTSTINSNSSGASSLNSSGVSSITQTTAINASESSSKKNDQPLTTTMHYVEGFALVMLCNCRSLPRKLAVNILKEVKNLYRALGLPETEQFLIDVIDKCCPAVLDKCLPILPQVDRMAILNANVIDLQWIADRTGGHWISGHFEDSTKSSTSTLNLNQTSSTSVGDPWAICLFGFMERERVLQQCPAVVAQAWPICYQRVTTLFNVIDPTPVNDNRASLLRSSAPPKKTPSESQRDSLSRLWKNQVIMAMRLVPPIPSIAVRCASPDLSLSSSPDSLNADRSDKSNAISPSPVALYKLVVPLLRCEVVDVRDAAVNALGMINHDALKDLMDELVIYIREAVDRKQENMRRRRRRDALRLQLVKVLEKIAENQTFAVSPCVIERDSMSLHPTFVEYMDGARLYLEMETDKDNSSIREVKIHFCDFIRKMIKNFSLESRTTLLSNDLKRHLFNLFASWSGPTAKPLGFSHGGISGSNSNGATSTAGANSGNNSLGASGTIASGTNTSLGSIAIEEEKLQFSALQAMSVLLCCGPCFDPQYLTEDGLIYPWIDSLLISMDEKVYDLARDIVVLLLESNPDSGHLLEWVIDRCYTAQPREADICFLSLATVFSAREYPCDHYTSVINITLLMTGCPRVDVHTTAVQLLQVLDKRFFGNVGPLQSEGEKDDDKIGTLDAILSTAYCRTQMYLSKQMAQLRPEITMPIFSEITHRFQTARPEIRSLLLQCLLPWLENMELVAANVTPATPLSYIMFYPDSNSRSKRDGSGSTEATEMILNNLFYITTKYSYSHTREIEEIWGNLCQFWPNNLKVILRYLVIISGMAPNELLPFAKRVALYLARACPNRLLDELMTELQTVETLNCLIERTETPPFYRLTSMRKASSHSDGPTTGANDSRMPDLAVEKGTIHTKRHSGEDPIKTGTCKSDSGLRAFSTNYRPPRGSDKIRALSGPSILPRPEDMISNEPELRAEESFDLRNTDPPVVPHPLPMPEYGGYFAQLTEFLPDISLPISGFHRCNVAVMLLTDIIIDGIPEIDWTLHIPIMLHILFLGLDHTRPIVRDHCKQLLLNLLVVLAEHNDHLNVAKILLNAQTSKMGLGLPIPTLSVSHHNFTEPDAEYDAYLYSTNSNAIAHSTSNSITPTSTVTTIVQKENHNASPNAGTTTNDSNTDTPTVHYTPEETITNTTVHSPQVIKDLINFLSQEISQPLWNYEDITAKVWTVKSAEQLTCFLHHIVKVYSDSYSQARISERWAQTALQLGLSCSSRHYAGRSLQVFRALNVPINSRMLSDILSRLVETVAEQGEDMQGYVTELLLTLEAAVDSLDSDFRPLDVMKDIFKSTPNLNNKDGVNVTAGGKKSPSGIIQQTQNHINSSGHTRSTSYSVSYCTRKVSSSPCDKQVELRNRAAALELERSSAAKFGSSLSRSRSAQSLKLLGDTATQDDKMTILAQLFWLAVSLLESDYEHEFLLALRLLSRVLHRLPLDRPDARDKVEKLQQQLKWTGYPGVHALLLKGCTHSVTYEQTISLLSQMPPLLCLPVCDPTQSCAFPMNVIALLPYMLLHYEDANEVCVRSAENIAQVSSELGAKLENLGTVMTLYSRKTFSKESFQWTKCVVKYLYDTYAHMGLHMLAFLVEVLEKGMQQVQVPVLNIIHCMLHYIDLSSSHAQPISSDLIRVIAKYLDNSYWKDALKILKLVVTRSSTLQVVPQGSPGTSHLYYGSFSDSEVFCKKELAGRTMDFTFDVAQTPLIGRRILLKSETGSTQNINRNNSQAVDLNHNIGGTPNSPRRSASLSPADTAPLSGWKRPWLSQSRVRECLVNLLTTCGQRAVGLPKSPSDDFISSVCSNSKVIFSQSSDLMERQSSAASSTEETSGAQQDLSGGSRRDDGQPDFGVFKDFDFLEYESESIEGESTDNFNWGVRRRPLSDGDSEPITGSKGHSVMEESLSEKTPILNKRRTRHNPEDSSDDDVESESPLDEYQKAIFIKSQYHSGPPTSLSIRERRQRRDSVSRSDTSGSSAGDLGEITPCNASPHMTGMISYRVPIRDEAEDQWRRNIEALLFNPAANYAPDLLMQLYRVVKELTQKSITIAKNALKYFTGTGTQLGQRISILSDLLSTKEEPPRIWYNQSFATTPRLSESLRYSVLEVQEHLETFFDRKDMVMECLEAIKTTQKLTLFSDTESAHEGSSNTALGSPDPAASELLIELGRGIYKLIFQLMLLIESDHKIAISVMTTMRQNVKMEDLSSAYVTVRGALLRCIDDADMDSLDTSTSTEGEHTPTRPLSSIQEFESCLNEMIEKQKWNSAIALTRQFRKYSSTVTLSPVSNFALQPSGSSTSCISTSTLTSSLVPHSSENNWVLDDSSLILMIYAQRLTKDRSDAFISSRSEQELTEIYNILMENLYYVSSALTNMEMVLKNTVGNPGILKQPPSSPAELPPIIPSPSKDASVDIITTL